MFQAPHMRTPGLKVIGFGMCLIVAAEAHAQPLVDKTQSIESTVANADLVFIAKVVDFRAEQDEDRDGHQTTIAIEETLKQPGFREEPYQQLSLHIPRPASVLADWKDRSTRLLIACDDYAPRQPAVIELAPDRTEVMTADVRLTRDPETVIRLAREAVTRLPANIRRVHTFDLQVPREVVAGTRWEKWYHTSGHLLLSVPVDQHLEKRAQDYVRSEDPHRRGEGARALAYFKSDENLALIRPLLHDAEVTYLHPAYDGKPAVRVYGVRISAYQTLKTWGIDVEQPVFREPVP
jgi:hypothetical protein